MSGFTREQAEALVVYRGDDSLRERIAERADKITESELTNRELESLDELAQQQDNYEAAGLKKVFSCRIRQE